MWAWNASLTEDLWWGNPGKFASLRKLKMFQWENHRRKWMAIVVSARQRQSARGLPIILYDSGLLVERFVFQTYWSSQENQFIQALAWPLIGLHYPPDRWARAQPNASHWIFAIESSSCSLNSPMLLSGGYHMFHFMVWHPILHHHDHHYHSAYCIYVFNPKRKTSATTRFFRLGCYVRNL